MNATTSYSARQWGEITGLPHYQITKWSNAGLLDGVEQKGRRGFTRAEIAALLRRLISLWNSKELKKRYTDALEKLEAHRPPEREPGAPKCRQDCINGVRPCPWFGCEFHISRVLGRWFWFQTDDEIIDAVFDLPETCILDVIDDYPGGIKLDDLAVFLQGTTKQNVNATILKALTKLSNNKAVARLWADYNLKLDACQFTEGDGDEEEHRVFLPRS